MLINISKKAININNYYFKNIKLTKSKCIINSLDKSTYLVLPSIKTRNNETIGQTAESALADFFKIKCYINNDRIDQNLKYKIINNLNQNKHLFNFTIISSEGYKNGKVDFLVNNNRTLSLKTLKRNDGKICPQKIGQPTLKSWDTYWKQDWNAKLEHNTDRFNFIKSNIHSYLNKMLEYVFCCDFLLLISNCHKDPKLEFIQKKLNYFDNQAIIFTSNQYIEKWNPKKNKFSEFSTTIKTKIDGKLCNIGEFQFHKSSRQELKFRFYKQFLINI